MQDKLSIGDKIRKNSKLSLSLLPLKNGFRHVHCLIQNTILYFIFSLLRKDSPRERFLSPTLFNVDLSHCIAHTALLVIWSGSSTLRLCWIFSITEKYSMMSILPFSSVSTCAIIFFNSLSESNIW